MKKHINVCMIILLVISLLTACGGASKDSVTIAETAAAYAPAAVHIEEAKDAGNALGGINAAAPIIEPNRKLIRTVHLDVETYDFDFITTLVGCLYSY